MSYLTTPLPTGSVPASTYQNLNINAAVVDAQYGFDHIAFDAGANNGMHQKITFPLALGTTPTPTGDQQVIFPVGTGATLGLSIATAAGIIGLSNIATTTVGTAPFQLTRMVLPSGLIIYYGIVANSGSPGANNFTITFTNSAEVTQYTSISPLQFMGNQLANIYPYAAGTASCSFNLNKNPGNYAVLIITTVP